LEIYENIDIVVDAKQSIIWVKIGSSDELHYSYKTICSFHNSLSYLSREIVKHDIKYLILLSSNKKVWNMGGDLEMFVNCVLNGDRELLRDYAHKCVKVVSVLNKNFGRNVITASVVQGNAFGGGFECALSTDYIIAEAQAKFSFPEVLFGTFPGMGAYSFLTRRVGFSKAQDMINSGEKWTATAMKEAGIVSVICEEASGIETILEMIKNDELKKQNSFFKKCITVSHNELLDIVDMWIESVMKLEKQKTDFMLKIVGAQKNKMVSI
jgi:DSF synthase